MKLPTLALLSALIAISPELHAQDVETSRTEISESETDESTADEEVSRTEISRTRVRSAEGEAKRKAEGQEQAGEAAPPPSGDEASVERTVITERRKSENKFRNEAVGIKPQFGLLSLDDNLGDGNTRGVLGMTVDINVLRRVKVSGPKPYLGPSIGVFYSHLGVSGGNFFGFEDGSSEDGTHLVMIPLNAKLGYTLSDVARVALHVGPSVIYNNVENGLGLNRSDVTTRMNVGLDFEFGIGKDASLMIRPDWTFGSRTTAFMGTLAIGFPMS